MTFHMKCKRLRFTLIDFNSVYEVDVNINSFEERCMEILIL